MRDVLEFSRWSKTHLPARARNCLDSLKQKPGSSVKTKGVHFLQKEKPMGLHSKAQGARCGGGASRVTQCGSPHSTSQGGRGKRWAGGLGITDGDGTCRVFLHCATSSCMLPPTPCQSPLVHVMVDCHRHLTDEPMGSQKCSREPGIPTRQLQLRSQLLTFF